MPKAATKHYTGPPRKPRKRERVKTAERGYDARWRRARLYYLRRHPWCVECDKHGLHVFAEHLDHIVPHKGSKELFWDETNWQGLCAVCHGHKSAKE